MIVIHSYGVAVFLAFITMLCWGSWANTQKLAQNHWTFQLYYWDYALGVLLLALLLAFTVGSLGSEGRSFLADLAQADTKSLIYAFLGGTVFNIANILVVAAIAIAGMAVAFPIGIGLALALGVIINYAATPLGNPVTLFAGVALVAVAIVLDALAYRRLPNSSSVKSAKGIVVSLQTGFLMGFFYRFVAASMSTDFVNPVGDMKASKNMNIRKLFLFHVFLTMALMSVVSVSLKAQSSMEFLRPQQVKVQGVLGAAIDGNTKGRITTLPDRDNGYILEIFKEEQQKKDTSGTSWQGELMGKWLYTAARAANRTQDPALRQLVIEMADGVVATQGADGYLGTYPPSLRMNSPARKNQNKSWDVWVQACLMGGLLEVNRYFPDEKYVIAVRRMADLLIKTYSGKGQDIVSHGECLGSSSVIVLGAVVELFRVTHELGYLQFAQYIIRQIDRHQDLDFINANLDPKADLSKMGQGKTYQLIWGFTGVLKLYQATSEPRYFKAMENAWSNIRDNYLTIGGGPSSGPNTMWNECFAERGVWQPDAMVETCSSFAWIQLNRELLQITGQAKYAGELEKTFYNQLLAASFFDGEGWAYFSMPNGVRHRTGTYMCCSASGSAALEEIAPILYGKKKGGIAVNCYTPSEATIELKKGNTVQIRQSTEYPFGPVVKIGMDIQRAAAFPLFLRKPVWARATHLKINGIHVPSPKVDSGYLVLQRTWAKGDTVEITFGCPIEFHSKEYANQSWLAITRGPLVYATSSKVKALPSEKRAGENFLLTGTSSGAHGPAIEWVRGEGRGTVTLLPFYEVGGFAEGSEHFVWLPIQKNKD